MGKTSERQLKAQRAYHGRLRKAGLCITGCGRMGAVSAAGRMTHCAGCGAVKTARLFAVYHWGSPSGKAPRAVRPSVFKSPNPGAGGT